MAFHVEISDGSNHARVFNMAPDELRDQVIVPFLAGDIVKLGDQNWTPAACEIHVFEGPRMENVDLAFGQGWGNALRKSRDVTAAALETVRASLTSAGVALLAAEPQDESYVGAALDRLGIAVLAWAPIRDRVLAGERDDIVVVVAVGDAPPDPQWWFDAGLAVGAAGSRALLLATGAEPLPAMLGGLATHRLDDGDAAFEAALVAVGATRPRHI